jgi:hypothetical protein
MIKKSVKIIFSNLPMIFGVLNPKACDGPQKCDGMKEQAERWLGNRLGQVMF